MRTLILTTQFPNHVEPTRGMFHLQMLRELRHLCDLRVVAPVQWPYPIQPYQIYRDVPMHESWDGIETYHPPYIHIPKVGRSMTGWTFAKSVQATVTHIHKMFPFDVLASYFVYPDGYAAVKLGRKLGVPVVVGARGTDINRLLFEGVRKHLVKRTLHQADALLSVSTELAQKMETVGIPPQKIRILTNGVDATRFHWRDSQAIRQQLGLPTDRKIILFVGWLTPLKGVPELIQAMQTIVERERLQQGQISQPKALLVLVGQGPLEPSLREIIATHHLQDHVLLAGSRPHEEIASWMNACDVFCLPSQMEGCPNVVIEARASGKPVVASAVGGIPDLIPDPRYGLLVPPGDSPALAKALQMALEREWDAEAILELAGNHTWRKVAEATYHYLQQVLDHKQTQPSREPWHSGTLSHTFSYRKDEPC